MKKRYFLIAAFTFGAFGARAQSAELNTSSEGLHLETKGRQMVLTWSAGIRKNAAGFRVQRSSDGTNWQEIGQLEVATGSDAFRLTDEVPLLGNSSYRLRIDERTGQFSYSNICKANPDASRTSAIGFAKESPAGK